MPILSSKISHVTGAFQMVDGQNVDITNGGSAVLHTGTDDTDTYLVAAGGATGQSNAKSVTGLVLKGYINTEQNILISTNATNIGTNDADIAANASNIASNAGDIVDNIAAIALNSSKLTNVSTTLSVGTNTTTELSITSDGGDDDVTLPVATTALTGVMNSAMFNKLEGITALATADQTLADIQTLLAGALGGDMAIGSDSDDTVMFAGDITVNGGTTSINSASFSVSDKDSVYATNVGGTDWGGAASAPVDASLIFATARTGDPVDTAGELVVKRETIKMVVDADGGAGWNTATGRAIMKFTHADNYDFSTTIGSSSAGESALIGSAGINLDVSVGTDLYAAGAVGTAPTAGTLVCATVGGSSDLYIYA